MTTAFERLQLRDKLEAVAPALSSSDIIPIMSHYWFTGSHVMAYNDRIAINCICKTDFKGALPGLLLQLLKASQAPKLELEYKPADSEVLFKLGSSRVRLAVLPPADFVFDMPALEDDANALKSTRKALVAGIAACLASVGNDTSMPEQLGVSILPGDDELHLFATNNATLSRQGHEVQAPRDFIN